MATMTKEELEQKLQEAEDKLRWSEEQNRLLKVKLNATIAMIQESLIYLKP